MWPPCIRHVRNTFEMLRNICKACQYCLESMYWKCCEERFCFDEEIAKYKLEEDVTRANGYANMGASLDSVIVEQPFNNNHLVQRPLGRELHEMPIHADKIYEVFSKSMIFREDFDAKETHKESTEELDTKSEPDYSREKSNRSKVYFEDEINSPVTDFEIMFKEELQANHDIFKIEEEDIEMEQITEEPEGLTMNVSLKKQDVVKPTTVTVRDEPKITTQSSIYNCDPVSIMTLPSMLSLTKSDNVKGILRQKKDLSRSSSARTLERVDSGSRLYKSTLNRVESMKNLDPDKINKVLARVPHRSASFLNIPEHLIPEKPKLIKSKSTIGVTLQDENDEVKLSRLPDTPIIKSNNLPRFFAESPTLQEYRGETSLQSIKQKSKMMFEKNDFSMPRYYGAVTKLSDLSSTESKSMPDLRHPSHNIKVSKRMVKLRGKLKPLVIKKGIDEKL